MHKTVHILLLLLICPTLTAQIKWGRAEVSYLHTSEPGAVKEGADGGFNPASLLVDAYRTVISDVDGDNCPFYPSCSAFFKEAADSTNLLHGMLMFADRFTRDLNFVNREERYPVIVNNRYYDPVSRYLSISHKH